MKKRRIVIASVLKPVDDTRAFEKMACTLAANDWEVFLVGQPSKNSSSGNSKIHFLPLRKFNRLSLSRLVAPLKVGLKIHQVKPELLIVNTHELLIVAVVNRIFFGTCIIYDIQENYWRNILLTSAFPLFLRPLLASWVRLKEKVTSPLFHHYFLAEKGYEKEIGFVGKKYTVVENKVVVPPNFKRFPKPEKIRLLFSGTLAESTGVFSAIKLAEKLHQIEPKIELLIIGFCAVEATLKEIELTIQHQPFITLKGGSELVPHTEIFEAISTSHFGIISYPISPHIENSIPTKLYEYLGCQLPILLQEHLTWVEICKPYAAAITINFTDPDVNVILHQMKKSTFYSKPPIDVTWESEAMKLLKVIENVNEK
jgi:glycosyltransferase involved in cell wall biosynthesis